MAIEDKNLNFNILVIDDDLLVLPSLKTIYEFLIEMGEFKKILGDQAAGKVITASGTKAAERLLQENFEKDSKILQILHVDERMPGERGSEFVDRMRRKFSQNNLGALLVTGYATDVSVINSRESGVYRYLPKPVNPQKIIPHLKDLFEMILLKEKPIKQVVEGVYLFQLLQTPQEIHEMMSLRFKVWSKMNYIPPDRLSIEKKLEADEFDSYSIPLGGFVYNNGANKLVTTARIITNSKQYYYDKIYSEIIDTHGDAILQQSFKRERKEPLIIYESYDGLIDKFVASQKVKNGFAEYSRFMNDPQYRGMELSIKTTQFLHMYSRFFLNLDFAFVECLVKHKQMNIEKNCFCGLLPGIETFTEQRVGQIAVGLFVDLRKFDSHKNTVYNREVLSIRDKFKNDGYFCYCNRSDCISNNYKYDQTSDCPRLFNLG